MGYNRSRRHEEWLHKTMTLPDGRSIRWTVAELPSGEPYIQTAAIDNGPCWVPEGRDLLKAAGHPDGDLRAHGDPIDSGYRGFNGDPNA